MHFQKLGFSGFCFVIYRLDQLYQIFYLILCLLWIPTSGKNVMQGCSQAFLSQAVFVEDWITSYGSLSRSHRERLLELRSRGCSEPPGRGPGGKAAWKHWISEHLEGLDEFILNTYQLKSGRKTHYKNYHNLLEYILFYTEQLSSPVIQNLSARLLLSCLR